MGKLLFLVGPHASGKSYSAKKYTAKHENIGIIDTGPIMRGLKEKEAPDLEMGEWIEQLEKKHGKNISSVLISREIKKIMLSSDYEEYFIIGFRSLPGILYTLDVINEYDYDILYLDGEEELLHRNYQLRKEENISTEEFRVLLDEEMKLGLNYMKELAIEEKDNTIKYHKRTSSNEDLTLVFDEYLKSEEKIKKKVS